MATEYDFFPICFVLSCQGQVHVAFVLEVETSLQLSIPKEQHNIKHFNLHKAPIIKSQNWKHFCFTDCWKVLIAKGLCVVQKGQ